MSDTCATLLQTVNAWSLLVSASDADYWQKCGFETSDTDTELGARLDRLKQLFGFPDQPLGQDTLLDTEIDYVHRDQKSQQAMTRLAQFIDALVNFTQISRASFTEDVSGKFRSLISALSFSLARFVKTMNEKGSSAKVKIRNALKSVKVPNDNNCQTMFNAFVDRVVDNSEKLKWADDAKDSLKKFFKIRLARKKKRPQAKAD